MNHNTFFLLLAFVCFGSHTNAQSLLDELNQGYADTPDYTIATFKSSRIALGHSTETLKKGLLEIGTRSRFWNIPNADIQSFVADKMSTRISLEYGINDRLTFGAGGTTLDGIFDTFFKYKVVRQNRKGFPFSITLLQNGSYQSKESLPNDIHQTEEFKDRLAFTSQLLISSKISHQFSVQVSPTFIHRASSNFDVDPNNQFAVGIGGRYKLNGHLSLATEYYQVFNPIESRDTYNAFAIGVNWELSDVMLQFLMTNTRGLEEQSFITQTPNNFNLSDGNFVFGFTAIFNVHLRNGLKK